MSTMIVEDARKALEQAMNSAIVWRNGDGVAEKVDALITAVRAETLAPATRGQSAELAEADELSRLRAENKALKWDQELCDCGHPRFMHGKGGVGNCEVGCCDCGPFVPFGGNPNG